VSAVFLSVITWFQTYSDALVGVSAVTATVAFVFEVWRRRATHIESQVNQWLKTNVHMLLHTSSHWLTAEEVLAKLRSSSFDTQLKMSKEKLTVEQVRKLLLEMLEAGVIIQRWGDKFGIGHYDHHTYLAETQSKIVQMEIAIYKLIYMAPDTFSANSHSLRQEIKKSVGLDVEEAEIALVLSSMSSRSLITVNKKGKWSPQVTPFANELKQIEAK
jgi:hypothetical protein